MNYGISRRLSMPELSCQVLDMAKTGVYRESIFDALYPLSTKKNIRLAIAHAKQFGMYSVADLRDEVLGTYYQVDLAQYEASREALNSPLIPDDPTRAIQLATDLLETLQWVVRLSLISAISLALVGCLCGWNRHPEIGARLLLSAAIVAGLWGLQKRLLVRALNFD